MLYTMQDFRIRLREKNADIVDPATLKDRTAGVSVGTTDEMRGAQPAGVRDQGLRRRRLRLRVQRLVNGRIDAIIASFFNGPA
jgi:ABC-type amino acid transport substrate-binding protein